MAIYRIYSKQREVQCDNGCRYLAGRGETLCLEDAGLRRQITQIRHNVLNNTSQQPASNISGDGRTQPGNTIHQQSTIYGQPQQSGTFGQFVQNVRGNSEFNQQSNFGQNSFGQSGRIPQSNGVPQPYQSYQ
ncbi:2894_t:CDS:2, partial [Paraglomus occultum]